jgi:hypothetical protein
VLSASQVDGYRNSALSGLKRAERGGEQKIDRV